MEPQEPRRYQFRFRRLWLWGIALGFFLIAFIGVVATAPSSFPYDTYIPVEKGTTLRQLSRTLKDAHIVRSSSFLDFLVILLGREKGVIAGEYYFSTPQSAFGIARRIATGDYGLSLTKVTIPEGSSVKQISAILDEKLPRIDAKKFERLAASKEGYLFPDTYSFLPTVNEAEVIEAMETGFGRTITSLKKEIEGSKHTLKDIVNMASILEEEARTLETRRIISGILWKRLSIGMPLQVDVTFQYINGKNSFDLTLDDLTIDSPYNTYKYAGLPPGPITNPGRDAILAAVTPISTEYLFFLADNDGVMHYATTHDEHVANKKKWLNQ